MDKNNMINDDELLNVTGGTGKFGNIGKVKNTNALSGTAILKGKKAKSSKADKTLDGMLFSGEGTSKGSCC